MWGLLCHHVRWDGQPLHPIYQSPNLNEAVRALQKDDVVLEALGSHIAGHFIEGKLQEWQDYISVVHPWEVNRYLDKY